MNSFACFEIIILLYIVCLVFKIWTLLLFFTLIIIYKFGVVLLCMFVILYYCLCVFIWYTLDGLHIYSHISLILCYFLVYSTIFWHYWTDYWYLNSGLLMIDWWFMLLCDMWYYILMVISAYYRSFSADFWGPNNASFVYYIRIVYSVYTNI